jgi:hypothetical protein
MARINLPTPESAMTPIQQTAPFNASEIKSFQNQVGSEYDQLTSRALSSAASFRDRAEAAEMAATEAENKASLMKLIPQAMQDIGDTFDKATAKIVALDQHQFEEEAAKAGRAYVLEEGIGLQEQYLKFRQQNPGNPAATLKFVNGQINEALSRAPTEDARLDLLSKASRIKYSALSNAFSEKRVRGKQERQSQVSKAYNSILEQVKVNPYDVQTSAVQLNDINKTLSNEGLPADHVDYLNKSMKSGVLKTQIQTFLQNGQVNNAADALRDKGYKATIEANEYKGLVDVTAQAFIESKLATYKKSDLRTGIAVLRAGAITPDMPKAKQYADADFLLNAETMMPKPSEITSDNYARISDSLNSYWAGQKVVGSDQIAYINNRLVYSGNPYEAAGYAQAIDKLFNDPNLKNIEVASQYGDSNKSTVGMALDISRQLKLGVPAADAVQNVRNHYASLNNKEESQWNKELDRATKEIKFDNLVESAIDKWNVYYNPNNQPYAAKEAENLFRAAYMKTGNVDTAKEMTKVALERDYSITEVNGVKEIMKNAPDKVLPGQTKRIVEGFHSEMGKYFTEAGLKYDNNYNVVGPDNKPVRIRMQPMYNGIDTKPGTKTFLVTDEGGRLIVRPDGNFLTYNVGYDPDAFIKEKENLMQNLGFEKDMTEERLRESAKNDIMNYILGEDFSKPSTEGK